MKAEELRIDNYVHSNLTGNNFPVTVYDIVNIHEECEVQPIPLTEEIIIKCGFIQSDLILSEWNLGTFRISQPEASKPEFMFRNYHWSANKRIKCLHQLQNLYFSLTDKELEINL